MLAHLRSLESQWKTAAQLMLVQTHEALYIPSARIPEELEVAISYWSARATMSAPPKAQSIDLLSTPEHSE